MTQVRDKYLQDRKGSAVLDVGARLWKDSKPFTYRELFVADYSYTGIDVVEGDNVDLVVADPYQWKEVSDFEYPIVISGQTLEHCERFWEVFQEMVRVLDTGGVMCVIAPWSVKEHRYPVDCWRILPDGMRALGKWTRIETVEAFVNKSDCVGVFRKC
jgi:SAM-dependent methyltransferase